MNLIEGQIIQAQLWAQFHIASAINGHCLERRIFKYKLYSECGPDDKIDEIKTPNDKGEVWALVEYTDKEKVDRAMEAAERHIHRIGEMIELLPSMDIKHGK